MKTLSLLSLLPGLFAIQTTLGQASHVTLSDPNPKAGETITLTYDPAGTPLDHKENIQGKIYFVDYKNYPAIDLVFKPDGPLLKSSFTIVDSTKMFFIKLSKDAVIDNNNDTGYVYLVYDRNNQPVPGAYACKATLLANFMGMALAKIKPISPADGIALFKKEFALYPESVKVYANFYYPILARSTDPADSVSINREIAALEKSGTKKDLELAETLYTTQKKKSKADSLTKVMDQKYPNGSIAETRFYNEFEATPDLTKRDSLYNVFVQRFHQIGTDMFLYNDFMVEKQAEDYADKGDLLTTNNYLDKLQNANFMPSVYNNIADELAKKGQNLAEAAKLSKKSLDLLQASIRNPRLGQFQSPADVRKTAKNAYYSYADTYALILYKQGHLSEALKYQQAVYDNTSKPLDAEVMEHYVAILNGVGKYKEARKAAEENIKAGKTSAIIEKELKTAYVKINGSVKGYNHYLATMQGSAQQDEIKELAKTMLNKPAPFFRLKDLAGNTVSLADLKGKLVIVDFWATWCGPCKASFPGMQMAVNQYKNDADVKFLFVDCKERGNNFNVKGVKKFIADNKYTFHVLLDEKTDDGDQAKLYNSFGVAGIPTKFIIDKNGNIRFKAVGLAGSSEQVAREVSDMITLAANPSTQN